MRYLKLIEKNQLMCRDSFCRRENLFELELGKYSTPLKLFPSIIIQQFQSTMQMFCEWYFRFEVYHFLVVNNCPVILLKFNRFKEYMQIILFSILTEQFEK